MHWQYLSYSPMLLTSFPDFFFFHFFKLHSWIISYVVLMFISCLSRLYLISTHLLLYRTVCSGVSISAQYQQLSLDVFVIFIAYVAHYSWFNRNLVSQYFNLLCMCLTYGLTYRISFLDPLAALI